MPSPEATVSPYLFSLSACIRSIRVAFVLSACTHVRFAMRPAWRRACRVSVPNLLALHTHTHCWLAGRAGWWADIISKDRFVGQSCICSE